MQTFDRDIGSIAPPTINSILPKIVHISNFEIMFLEFVRAKYSNKEKIDQPFTTTFFDHFNFSRINTGLIIDYYKYSG
jgi:hypothetical protein